ncbi:MAG: RluA family pseudouridine synthase [Clostridia bacterium]|nr:RluA family pseudouridine synthase [Clostridia bacterium]
MSAILETRITEENSGKTVEKILKREFGVSSGLLKHLRDNGKICLNGNVCRTVDLCYTGDFLSADVSENLSAPSDIQPFSYQLEILFEDEFILVVNKPGGMASHPCPGNRNNSLANAVMNYWQALGEYRSFHIVNRLDKDTSGICVIAKNTFSHSVIAEQMKNGIFKRQYTAIVHGIPKQSEGVIESPIGRVENSVLKRMVTEDGKYAKTLYKVHSVYKDFSKIEIELETGRTHQIRVHFSYMGHPLVGDWLYGNGDNEKHLISRQALHAGFVSFCHPKTKEKLVFECDMPQDMKKLLSAL